MEKMGFFRHLFMAIMLFSIGLCTVLLLGICAGRSNAPYLSNEDAINTATRYTYGESINIDELMFDQGYFPVNQGGGVCSWTNGQDHIWLEVSDGYVTTVACESGFDQCYWEDTWQNIAGIVYKNGERCEISATALAALISVANGHYDGFKSV